MKASPEACAWSRRDDKDGLFLSFRRQLHPGLPDITADQADDGRGEPACGPFRPTSWPRSRKSAAASPSGHGCAWTSHRCGWAGIAGLGLFAWALTRVDADFAGRAYAAYGGIYILGVADLDVRGRGHSTRPLEHHWRGALRRRCHGHHLRAAQHLIGQQPQHPFPPSWRASWIGGHGAEP